MIVTYSKRCVDCNKPFLTDNDSVNCCNKCFYGIGAIDNRADSLPGNPKDVVGAKKVSMSVVPASVLMELSLAMREGALKYGAFNWRAKPIKAMEYYNALWRHMAAWAEGEDVDEESGLPHIVKALATLVVLRDAQRCGKVIDDRPPASPPFMAEMNEHAARLAGSLGSAAAVPCQTSPA